MTWADFYLICFVVGLLLSVLAFILGDLHLHIHLPFHIHLPNFDFGHVDSGHGIGAGDAGGLPAINFGTLTTFLAWFGGIGYLLVRHSNLYALSALGVAFFGGLVGAAIVFFVISRVFLRNEADYIADDGDMVGVLGRITSSVFQGGTGELTYVQGGTRHSCAARTDDGSAISKGTEVVVTRYDRGVAYVKPWEELEEEYANGSGADSKQS
ncbi:MAG TPA: hypothetical protein VN577_17330 [Terriglobales bacterium]|nr:hypothetical protein [Terriglobales bacterium]